MFKKIPYQTSGQVLHEFTLSDEAQPLLTKDASIKEAIETLQANQLYNDLVQFISHAIPVREAIWWASLCIKQRHESWSPEQTQCIQVAQRWTQSPAEDLRRKAEMLANELNLNCGPSWLAQAVFWNGSGSIVSEQLPRVLPDPFLYAKAVAGAINHSAALPVWDSSEKYYKNAITWALNIASGGNGEDL